MGKQTTAISLTEHFETFIREQTSDGRYESPSAVVQAGLRLLEERETKLVALRKAIADGLASGDPVPFDFQELYDEIDSSAA